MSKHHKVLFVQNCLPCRIYIMQTEFHLPIFDLIPHSAIDVVCNVLARVIDVWQVES